MDDKKFSKEKYNNFIKDIHITSINVKSLFIDDVKLPEDEELSVELIYSCDEFEKINNLIEFYPMFQVTIKDKMKGLVNINFKFSVSYSVLNLSEYENQYIEKFQEKNLPVNVWPYARELVSSLTTRIGYPALIIEPFKQ